MNETTGVPTGQEKKGHGGTWTPARRLKQSRLIKRVWREKHGPPKHNVKSRIPEELRGKKYYVKSLAPQGAHLIYGEKKKRKALELVSSGWRVRDVAAKFGVTSGTIYYWRARLKGGVPSHYGNRNNHTGNYKPRGTVAIIKPTAQEQPEIDIQHQNQISFAVGHVKSWLSIYAESIEVPSKQFTRRVGELLLRSTHG